ADLGVQVIEGRDKQPTVSIDLSQMGGMYANHIRLIGTEAGVGVRSMGNIAAQAGDIQIDSSGKLTFIGDTTAAQRLQIASGESIVNQGTLSAGGDIDLHASDHIDNQAAQLLAGGDLKLNSNSLDNTGGVIQANGNASLSLSHDYTHAQGDTLNAVGDLAISTSGNVINQGELTAGGNLSVQAATIANHHDGLLSAGQLTLLKAGQTITNTGRIFGDDIAIGAQSLTNDSDRTSAGVIAARNTLHIGAQQIINREHALLKSESNLAIGGSLDAEHHATGSADSIVNSSATIDSAGQLAITSAALTNTNAHFASEIELDPSQTRHWTEYELDGNPTVYRADDVFTSDSGSTTKLVIRATGASHDDYTTRRITETTSRTVVIESDPGQIRAGGDLLLSGGSVLNDKSVIVAGGTLSAQIEGLDNGGSNPLGEIYVHQDITSTHHTSEKCAGGFKRCNKESTVRLQRDLPVTHFDLGIWQADSHQPYNSIGNPAHGQTPRLDQLTGHQLYRPVTTPDATYLIETHPAYTNYRRYLSSDYLFGRLSMDPQAMQKRLGDGYYEQQLITNQILQLTGRQTLGTYASQEAQYQALMDAGVAYAQQFALLPGMALSAAQMATLTTDMVWLVEQTVMLADGSSQQVLVPVVYLSKLHADDVKPSGALIAADKIDLRLNGSLDNAGTLQADQQLVIQAGTDINNRLGTLSSKGDTLLVAGRDINNQSGTIQAEQLALLAGRDIQLETLTNTSTSSSNSSIQIALDRISTINAGTVTAQAQRDLNVSAAVITSSGDTSLMAGRDLNLKAVTTQDELNVTYDSKNHLYQHQEQANGSVIHSGGNTNLVAGHDLNTAAAYVNAEQDLNVLAGGAITIGSATHSSTYDQEVYVDTDNVISSSSKHIRDQQSSTQAIGTTLSGDKLTLQAGTDLHVIGSDLVATQDLQLTATNNVNILTSQNSASQTYRKEEKTSGVFSGGGIGITVGVKTEDNDQTSHQVSNNASTLGSTNGHVSISAGKTYTQTG
ncbi:adhesin HecA-like repeat protein, partial [Herbaspirillum sp. Sphag1AN]|uniref:hemagglutinin repeat-containing protein n=1 Tax=unclassified Herbaspirillum TaxID=2624150 RepID=UPI00160FCF2B